jgi:hypothetical protein
MPCLTVPMVALIQSFPSDWVFTGKKTPAHRQVGNAFPPPVARAVGRQIYECLTRPRSVQVPFTFERGVELSTSDITTVILRSAGHWRTVGRQIASLCLRAM